MEVAQLYADRSRWPVFSAETFPTENFRPIDAVLRAVEELRPHIQVVTTTWGALGSPRGGTPTLSRIIHEKFDIPTVVHLTIQAKTKRDIENILRSMYLDGLNNVLALGGDPPAGVVDYVPAELRHKYARDLVEQIACLNQGLWLDPEGQYTRSGVKTHFGIAVAGFPEMHPDAYRADETWDQNMRRNIEHLKLKVDAGAHYVVEQMIFDADLHFRFAEAARAAGITVPIIPGILPFDRYSQASRFLGDTLRISMPAEISTALEPAPEEDQAGIAADYMAAQVQKLLDGGAPGIHFYCMNRSGPTLELIRRLRT
jgi:methylenetetrahydrofolate reductase (NADPH)